MPGIYHRHNKAGSSPGFVEALISRFRRSSSEGSATAAAADEITPGIYHRHNKPAYGGDLTGDPLPPSRLSSSEDYQAKIHRLSIKLTDHCPHVGEAFHRTMKEYGPDHHMTLIMACFNLLCERHNAGKLESLVERGGFAVVNENPSDYVFVNLSDVKPKPCVSQCSEKVSSAEAADSAK